MAAVSSSTWLSLAPLTSQDFGSLMFTSSPCRNGWKTHLSPYLWAQEQWDAHNECLSEIQWENDVETAPNWWSTSCLSYPASHCAYLIIEFLHVIEKPDLLRGQYFPKALSKRYLLCLSDRKAEHAPIQVLVNQKNHLSVIQLSPKLELFCRESYDLNGYDSLFGGYCE